jgi:predicted dehydrogenase
MTLLRRRFLQSSVVTGAGLILCGTKASGRVIGANDRIRIGVAGLNGRGSSHVGAYAGMKDVEIAYLVDPDTRTYAKHLKTIASAKGETPKTIQDIRTALEDKNLDAISIATPNHWHALMTIWGCQAGKDVYVEKPCSHNVHEGRIAVEMARKHNCIVQHGTQNRSSNSWEQLAALVKSEKLGKLKVARGLCYKRRASIGMKPNSAPPSEVDFNLWLEPAPDQPHHGNLVHYNWHWFWDFGCGDIGNQGVHQMDVARWMIPNATLPKSVFSLGGRFGYTDQAQTPNTQIAVFDYGETQLIFEVRGLKTESYYDQGVNVTLHFDSGVVAGGKFYPQGSKEPQPLPKLETPTEKTRSGSIFGNFIACMRSRKREELQADILEAHYSSALCHMANASYRLGEEVPFDPQTKKLGDNKEAYETLARMEHHLGQENSLELKSSQYRLGRKLEIDAKTERFVNAPDANQLLTRNYRAPFTVPEKV